MVDILENVPLAGKTSYKIGGPARLYAEPHTEEDIADLYRRASGRGVPAFVLGNGSNLLVSDKGINALVINLSARFSGISWHDGGGSMAAVALSGFLLDDLAAAAASRGRSGIEGLSGIPGTVGGAVAMNAGAFGAEVARTLRSARVLRVPALVVEDVSVDDLAFGYRSSAIKGGGDIVLSAVFEFEAGDAGELVSSRKRILEKRAEKQPLDYPSCGSVFKRPIGNYAGTLIESCGLKGFRLGGAAVSEKHANFIINAGNAKAEDVRGVIRHVQKTVYENSGVLLEPEVIFAGEFEEPLYTPLSS
jgi:UDP-N-acetylmuramate dehydrogenase